MIPRWVKGLPDCVGLWVVERRGALATAVAHVVLVEGEMVLRYHQWIRDVPMHEVENLVVRSFGPIPAENPDV